MVGGNPFRSESEQFGARNKVKRGEENASSSRSPRSLVLQSDSEPFKVTFRGQECFAIMLSSAAR